MTIRNAVLLNIVVAAIVLLVDGRVAGDSIRSAEDDFQNELVYLSGHTVQNDYSSPLPHTYIHEDQLPESFTWGDVDGVSYLTKSLNQHVPQYCGSCWAHGALSSLADRIKIARRGQGDDIHLSVQYILNCASQVAGSCHGGSASGTYEFIKSHSGFIPYDTCQPYLACSSDSTNGFCPHVDTSCNAMNTCRTCSTWMLIRSTCDEIDMFPNATVAEYGHMRVPYLSQIKAEVIARGPVAAAVNGKPLRDYTGGIFSDDKASKRTSHIVSIVGWGKQDDKHYWIIRNSWGQYWGLLGYGYIEMGKNILGIESAISWATPGTYTVVNYPCDGDGGNCGPEQEVYVDPSFDPEWIEARLVAR